MKNGTSNFQQALWLGIGQFCTFAIAFLTAPILARYFDKVEYGTYKQILYIYTTLQTLFTVGLPSAFSYFIPKLNSGQQKQLVNKLTIVLFLIGAVFAVALFFLSGMIAKILNNPELASGLRIFAVFPLFTLPAMGVEGIYTALRRTKEVAVYNIVSKVLMTLCIVLPVVIWHTGYKAAIIGWGVASFQTFLIAMYMKNKPYRKVSSENISCLYKSIVNYVLPLSGAFIAGFFLNFADQFYISHYYGTEVFAEAFNGYFSIPIIAMVAGSVKGVLLPLFSKADFKGELKNTMASYENAVKKTATIVLPILLFCMYFSEEIMTALFGEQYAVSANYFRLYILRDFFEIIPYYSVLMAFGFSKFYMNLHVGGILFTWGLDLLIVTFTNCPPLITLTSSLFQISFRVFSIYYIKVKKGVSLISSEIVTYILRVLLHGAFILTILFLINRFLINDANVFIILISLGLIFLLAIILTERIFKLDYLESIKLLLKRNKSI